MKKRVRQILFYISLIAVWQVIAELRIWPPYLFPSPWKVADSLRMGFSDGSLPIAVGVSLRRMAIGYGLSAVLGIALGILLASSKYLEETVGPLVLSLQGLPSLCWLPLAVLWFGLSESAIIFVVVMGSLLSMTISTETGLRNVPRIYSLAGRNLGAHGFQLFLRVLLPVSLPHIVSGLKQGWAFAWRSLISGEMIFVSLGLGQMLMMGRDLNDMSQVVAVMALIVIIGFAVDRVLFRSVERSIQRKWGLATTA